MKLALILLAITFSLPAQAEYKRYGSVTLQGLSRDQAWPSESPGATYSMVCNVNGPDGYLNVRSCAGTNCSVNRTLRRLAIVQLNTEYRYGHWVWVDTAFRYHTEDGYPLAEARSLPVTGWVHDAYLCDFKY